MDHDSTDNQKDSAPRPARRGPKAASGNADLPPGSAGLEDIDPATATAEDDDEARLPEEADERTPALAGEVPR